MTFAQAPRPIQSAAGWTYLKTTQALWTGWDVTIYRRPGRCQEFLSFILLLPGGFMLLYGGWYDTGHGLEFWPAVVLAVGTSIIIWCIRVAMRRARGSKGWW
jgi:hypothetical protein